MQKLNLSHEPQNVIARLLLRTIDLWGNEPRNLIRTRHLKEKKKEEKKKETKKKKQNGGPGNGTSGHGATGLYLTPRKRITLLGAPAISTRAAPYQAFLLTATAKTNANLS